MPWLKRLSRRGRSLIWVSVCGKHEEDIVLPWMMHIERYICHNRCICCSYAPYAWGKTTICLNFYSYESVVFPCHSDHFAVWLNRYNACSSEYLQGCWSYAINSTKVKRILPLWLPKYKHWPCAHVKGFAFAGYRYFSRICRPFGVWMSKFGSRIMWGVPASTV